MQATYFFLIEGKSEPQKSKARSMAEAQRSARKLQMNCGAGAIEIIETYPASALETHSEDDLAY